MQSIKLNITDKLYIVSPIIRAALIKAASKWKQIWFKKEIDRFNSILFIWNQSQQQLHSGTLLCKGKTWQKYTLCHKRHLHLCMLKVPSPLTHQLDTVHSHNENMACKIWIYGAPMHSCGQITSTDHRHKLVSLGF